MPRVFDAAGYYDAYHHWPRYMIFMALFGVVAYWAIAPSHSGDDSSREEAVDEVPRQPEHAPAQRAPESASKADDARWIPSTQDKIRARNQVTVALSLLRDEAVDPNAGVYLSAHRSLDRLTDECLPEIGHVPTEAEAVAWLRARLDRR